MFHQVAKRKRREEKLLNQFSKTLLEVDFWRLVDFKTICIPPYTPSYDICMGGQGPCQFICGQRWISQLTAWARWAQPNQTPPFYSCSVSFHSYKTGSFSVRLQSSVKQKRCPLWGEELLFQLKYQTCLEKSSDSNRAFKSPLLISRQPLCCWKVTPYLTPAEWNPVAKIIKHLVLCINNTLC